MTERNAYPKLVVERKLPISTRDFLDPVVAGEMARDFNGLEMHFEVAPRSWVIRFESTLVTAFETDVGLVLIDTGLAATAEVVHKAVREHTDAPLHTVIYTHGHIDHAFGMDPWVKELGHAPRVVAQRGVPGRLQRYIRTAPHNTRLNNIQFNSHFENTFSSDPQSYANAWPNVLFDESLSLGFGDEVFHLRHVSGESDDSLWVWIPSREVAVIGEFWTGVLPNPGNPQKVQRSAEKWADALDEMASVPAKVFVRSGMVPLAVDDKLRGEFHEAAAYLRAIVEQTLAGLNAGLTHDEIIDSLDLPDPKGKRHLTAHYDRPEFIARNVIRLYGGWWNGNAADGQPAPPADKAAEIVRLAGGPDAVVARARELSDAGEHALACHLAEWVGVAEPQHRAAQECMRDVFDRRRKQESAVFGRALLTTAIVRAEQNLAALDADGN